MKVFVKVKPKAREEKIEKVDVSHYIIHTKELAEKGKANEGVISIISGYLSIPKSKIAIVSGFKSRLKVIVIQP